MNLKLIGLVLGTGALLLGNACIITDDDTSLGGSGTGGAAGGSTGNMGGGSTCETAADCPDSAMECMEPTCNAGACEEIASAIGSICATGVCDGAGACVECNDDMDCDTAAGETCDTATNTCVAGTLGGACGPNLCELLPADNACITCAQTKCNPEVVACASDGTNNMGMACIDCLEWANGGGDPTCAGSAAKAQAIIDCACTIGNCAE